MRSGLAVVAAAVVLAVAGLGVSEVAAGQFNPGGLPLSGGTMTGDIDMNGNDIVMNDGIIFAENGAVADSGHIKKGGASGNIVISSGAGSADDVNLAAKDIVWLGNYSLSAAFPTWVMDVADGEGTVTHTLDGDVVGYTMTNAAGATANFIDFYSTDEAGNVASIDVNGRFDVYDASNVANGWVGWFDSGDDMQIGAGSNHEIRISSDNNVFAATGGSFKVGNNAAGPVFKFEVAGGNGQLTHAPTDNSIVQHTLTLPSGQTADAFVIEDSANADLFSIEGDGRVTFDAADADCQIEPSGTASVQFFCSGAGDDIAIGANDRTYLVNQGDIIIANTSFTEYASFDLSEQELNIPRLTLYNGQAITVADSGDGNPATDTTAPDDSNIVITCNDVHGCAWDFTETAVDGFFFCATAETNDVTISRSDGIREVPSAGLTLTAGADTACFMHMSGEHRLISFQGNN